MPHTKPIKHFTNTQELGDLEAQAILSLAKEMKAHWHAPLLKGKKMGMIFFSPSFRTRMSFKVAMFDLGGYVVDLLETKDLWKVETREGAIMDGEAEEHLKELVGVLSRYCNLLGVRANGRLRSWEDDRKEHVLNSYMKYSTVPVINLESPLHHPCQAMADWMTMQEVLGNATHGKKIALTWTYHPNSRPMGVPISFTEVATRLGGADVTVVCPEAYRLPEEFNATAQANARKAGGKFGYVHNLEDGLRKTDIVYAASWSAPDFFGRPKEEYDFRRNYRAWCVDAKLMAATNHAAFLHGLPIRRNVSATDEVLDSPACKVLDLAENRLHVQKAILVKLCEANGI